MITTVDGVTLNDGDSVFMVLGWWHNEYNEWTPHKAFVSKYIDCVNNACFANEEAAKRYMENIKPSIIRRALKKILKWIKYNS